jgi:L-fucose dehydrogenase
VVNVASKVAVTGQCSRPPAGKYLALTRVGLNSSCIRVNAVVPAGDDPAPPVASTSVNRATLTHRAGSWEADDHHEVAAAAFLFPQASHIGQFLHVDGGYVHLDRAPT